MCFLIQKQVYIHFLNNQKLLIYFIYFNQIDVLVSKTYIP